jgi:hypothetical protein
MFIALIFLRIVFAACMVFIIGYVFGPFAKRPALRGITKIASILAVVLFISTNILLFRIAHGRSVHNRNDNGPGCYGWQQQPQQQQAPANTKPAP